MADLGLEDALVRIKTTILENPTSELARKNVEDELQGVLKKTAASLQSYSMKDFLKLMEFSILSVSYARKGLDDIPLLLMLAGVVPSKLGVEILCPVEEEDEGKKDGKRRFWYYSDVISDLPIVSVMHGSQSAYQLLKQFGNYAMFLSGIMPDVLMRTRDKGGVDIPYYERFGSSAFKSTAKNPLFKGTHVSETLDEIALNFKLYRMLLNEAAAIVGTQAKKTLTDNMLEEYGRVIVTGYTPRKGWLERREKRMRIAGLLGNDNPTGPSQK